jgi:hypothetical protein
MDTTNEEEVKVVRQESCQNISKTGSIFYEIGAKGESQFIRLVKSSKGGLCSRNWISMTDIQKLEGLPYITAKALKILYGEKSNSNNCYFLLAALINEKMAAGMDTTSKESIPADTTPTTPPQKKPAKNKQPS